jgi:hypothetical protein
VKKLIFALPFILLFAGCGDRSLGLPVTYTIKYEVTGTANSVSITMNNAGDNTEQLSNVPVPWEKTFSVELKKDSYYFAYVSAQNNGSSGSVIARIYKDEKLFKEATSSGAYVIATASGSVDY